MKLRRVEYSQGGPITEARPDQIKAGYFHGWFQYQDGADAGCMGVVENTNGTVYRYLPENIKFLDNPVEGESA